MANRAMATEPTPGEAPQPQNAGRRDFLQKVGIGATIAWTAPMIISSAASAQSSLPVPPFIAVGSDGSGLSFTSTDAGLTWPVTATAVASGEMHSVAYSDFGTGKWIAVGRDLATGGTLIFTSIDDGVSWTSVPAGQTGRLLGVATDGAGNWVAVGEAITTFPGEPYLLYSNDDGVTWQDGTFGTLTTSLNTLHSVATDGTTWIVAGQNDAVEGVISISTDGGVNWSDPIVLATEGHVFDVATDGAGRWVAVGSLTGVTNNLVFWYATGGAVSLPGNWTQVTGIGGGFLTGVASDKVDTFVVVGRGDDPTGGALSFTLDSVSMTAGTFPGPLALALHEVGTDQNGTWIAVGYDGGGGPMRTYTSTDFGLNWTDTSSPAASGILLGIAAKVVA